TLPDREVESADDAGVHRVQRTLAGIADHDLRAGATHVHLRAESVDSDLATRPVRDTQRHVRVRAVAALEGDVAPVGDRQGRVSAPALTEMDVRARCLPSICIQGQRRIGYADLPDPSALTSGQRCGAVVTVQLQRGSIGERELSAPAVRADIEKGTIARNGNRGAESAYRHPPGAALAVGIAADPEAVGV